MIIVMRKPRQLCDLWIAKFNIFLIPQVLSFQLLLYTNFSSTMFELIYKDCGTKVNLKLPSGINNLPFRIGIAGLSNKGEYISSAEHPCSYPNISQSNCLNHLSSFDTAKNYLTGGNNSIIFIFLFFNFIFISRIIGLSYTWTKYIKFLN